MSYDIWPGQSIAPMKKHDPLDSDAHIVIPCTEHTQKGNARGYGSTQIDGHKSPLHRAVYCRSRGVSLLSIAGLVVRHDCDNSRCIEPLHLRAGTQKENVADMFGRGRNRPLKGVDNGYAKLTDEKIREIRAIYEGGGIAQKSLAQIYGVDPSGISEIVNLRRWAHVTAPLNPRGKA